MVPKKELVKKVVGKMVRRHLWGGKHTLLVNLQKGFPTHIQGEIKGVVRTLLKRNIIIQKPTGYGLEVSLNPKMKKEIEDLIK